MSSSIVKSASNSLTLSTLNQEDFEEVKLARIWQQFQEKQSPLVFVPVARSGDVRDAFPSKKGMQDGAKYLWACELIVPVSVKDKVLFQAKEPCAAPSGTIFFMFEKGEMRDVFANAAANNYPIRLTSLGKKDHVSSTYGDVKKWTFRVDRVTRPYALLSGASGVVFPESTDEMEVTE